MLERIFCWSWGQPAVVRHHPTKPWESVGVKHSMPLHLWVDNLHAYAICWLRGKTAGAAAGTGIFAWGICQEVRSSATWFRKRLRKELGAVFREVGWCSGWLKLLGMIETLGLENHESVLRRFGCVDPNYQFKLNQWFTTQVTTTSRGHFTYPHVLVPLGVSWRSCIA